MTYDKESKAAFRKKQAIKDYTEEDFAEDFADVSYMKIKGDLPESLKEEKKDVSVKKVVSILKMSTGQSMMDTLEGGSILSPTSKNTQVIVQKEESTKKKSQDLALALKQDIARRQWEKKIDMTWMDNYLNGTIEK